MQYKLIKYCVTFLALTILFKPNISHAYEYEDKIRMAEELYQAARITCLGISDEISKVSNISKANTAVSAVGTAASTGALAVGIKKSQEEEEIEKLIDQICKSGGCTAKGVEAMSDEQFFNQVLQPMAELYQLQKKIEKSKTLGNWRTGLMAGTIGTNLASAIMSGININQSELIQHITACNEAIEGLEEIETELKKAGVSPIQVPVAKNINNARTWCNKINTKDIEKIENRMKGVLGTSVVGGAIGVVGTATSAAANSDKYMAVENKVRLTESEKKTEHALNTTANVMAGANIATGAVELGLNISLISLTKKLMQQAERCENVLQ
jgi:hypothetical protein